MPSEASSQPAPPAEVEEDELDFEARKQKVQEEEDNDIKAIQEEWGDCESKSVGVECAVEKSLPDSATQAVSSAKCHFMQFGPV